MVGLSVMYLGGQGVAKDRREAFVWLNLAAQYMADKQALTKVKNVRDEIGRTLTKDDVAFAKAESLLLQPETSSVQPNEAESIDHLPDALPAQEQPAAVSTEPLQNVPPDTAPISSTPSLPEMELQPSLPAAPRPAATTPPATTTPASTMPASTMPASTAPASTTLPATTLPATTKPVTAAQPLPPPPLPPTTTNAAPADPVDPVPEF
jgi:hypothetical protein